MQPLKALRTAALVLSAFSLGTTGCTNHPTDSQQSADAVSASFSIGAQDLDAPASSSQGRSLSALSTAQANPAFSFNSVKRLVIDVKEKDTGNLLYVNFDLLGPPTSPTWTGKIPFLPKNKALTFTARAYADTTTPLPSATPLFSGTTDQTLTSNNTTIVVALAPANNGESISLPRITRISIPSAFGSEQSGNVSFSVEASVGETLSYSITPASGGGTFYPLSGSITLSATAGTFVSQYAPPTVSAETDFEHVVKVTNSHGHSITTTFKTHVKPPGTTSGVKDTTMAVLFNPVINSLTATRVLGTGNVIFQANVADDSAADTLTYTWGFTPDGTFSPEPSFTGTGNTNPTTLTNYTTALQGTLTLAVTDVNGGTTTLSYPLTPNQFPDNPVAEGPLTGINSIRGGADHTCVLFNNGTVRCWGSSAYGQLGYDNTFSVGATNQPYTAGDVPLVGVGARLAVGGNHTCALLDSGFVRCWGRNNFGQLGYNIPTNENVGDGEAISSYGYVNLGGIAVKITAGLEHTCALMDTGNVRCWGHNNYGQLGYGNTAGKYANIGDDEQPYTAGDVDVGGTVRDISAGGYHTCALLNTGKVRCWGRNDHGQLGYGNTTAVGVNTFPSSAGDVDVGGTVLQISAGDLHTCALLDTGYVRCWGDNENGRLGYKNYSYYYGPYSQYYYNTDVGNNETPASAGDVDTGGQVLQVDTGAGHTCALLSTGGIKCWGANGNGQLGLGNTTNDLYAPATSTVDLKNVTAYQIATGSNHTCVLLSDGGARCWGANASGQLGLGNNSGTLANLGDNEQVSSVGEIQLLTPAP